MIIKLMRDAGGAWRRPAGRLLAAVAVALCLGVARGQEAAPDPAAAWQVIPGAEADISRLTGDVLENDKAIPAWESFLAGHADGALRVIVGMSEAEAYKSAAVLGFKLYLMKTKPQDVVRAAQALPPAGRERLPYLFDRQTLDGTSVNFAQRTVLVLSQLGDYSRAFDWGHQAWLRWRTAGLITHLVRTVRRGHLEPRLWEVGGQRLLIQPNENGRALEVTFYAELAARLDAGPVIHQMVDIAELDNTQPELLQLLCEPLAKLGMREDIKQLLHERVDPALMYLRYRDGLQREPTEAEWADILVRANTARECSRLGRLLVKDHEPRSEAVWEKLLTCEGAEPVLVADAYLQLARAAERKANFAGALAMYRKLQQHLAETANLQLAGYDERLAGHMKELEEKLAGGQTAYEMKLQLARVALQDEDLKLATERLLEALKLDGEQAEGLSMLFTVYARDDQFDKLPDLAAKLAQAKTDDPELLVPLAFNLADGGYLDQALAYADRAVKAFPDQARPLIARSAVRERQGDYEQALADLDAAAKLEPERSRILVSRGLVYAKQGDLRKAIENLEHYAALEDDDYVAIWLFVLHKRLGEDDTAALTERLDYEIDDDEAWVVRLYEYLLGRRSGEQLLAAARAIEPEAKRRGCLCEAWFYIGQIALAKGDLGTAREDFRKTIDQGVIVFMEHHWAEAELKRLAQPR